MRKLMLITGVGFLLLNSCQDTLKLDNRRLEEEVDTLKVEIQTLKEENNRLRVALGDRPQIGFEVQIGAFEFFNVAAYEAELLRLREINEDGVSKYILGTFIRFEDAQAFLKDVHKMGISDAFIAGIVDGKRTTVEEAREAAEIAFGK